MPPTSGTITPPEFSPSYRVTDISIDEILHSGHSAPPNTPSSDYSLSPRAVRRSVPRKSMSPNLVHNVDLRAINYEGTIDENLICPICRCPLIDPVTTSCDHTFCSACIEESMSQSQICPIDRSTLSQDSIKKSPKLIYNQLDSLRARCPCCELSISRSLLANHLEKYCPDGLVRCPGRNTDQNCTEKIKRKLSGQGCLHYTTECPDCEAEVVQIDMEAHRETICKERNMKCGDCGLEILRCNGAKHNNECPDIIVPCRWAEYNCLYKGKRRGLDEHAESCSFKSIGMVAETLKRHIFDLKAEVRTLTEKNQMQERRIRFLETGSRELDRSIDLSEISDQSLSTIAGSGGGSLEQLGEEYLASMLESHETRINQLSAGMTEAEGRQTTLLFNETMPIKNELAEIRSMQQTTSMHVRWLMRFRMQENNRRAGGVGGGSNGDGSDGAGLQEPIPPRRISDSSSRDLITKL